MRITSYKYSQVDWKTSEVEFKDLNLLVGDSGVGKTRIFNTLFNIGSYVARSNIGIGDWELQLEVNGQKFRWCCLTKRDEVDPEEIFIEKESLASLTSDSEKLIIDRDESKFLFQGTPIPKLSKKQYALSLLQEEDTIKPIYEGFCKILRRKFHEDALKQSSTYRILNLEKLLSNISSTSTDLYELFKLEPGLNTKLYILERRFPKIYSKILEYFYDIFPFIESVEFKESNELRELDLPTGMPVLCIKEVNIQNDLIPLHQLSSGMQKALLIITDILSIPEGSIYLLDEYENSLGISVISLLPDMYSNGDIKCQLFVSSHHPYIIRNIPVENWYVLYRNGNEVHFRYGEELEKNYNLSSQDKYFQLINDDFYTEGIT